MEKKEEKKVFQVPASMSGYQGLSHGQLKLVFHTQENLKTEEIKRLIELHEKTGWLSFNVEAIEAENIANLPKIDSKTYDGGKTPSQRLRSKIWVLWYKQGEIGIFEDYRIKCYARFEKSIQVEIDKFE